MDELSEEIQAYLAVEGERREQFEAGEYELDEWEGFYCESCGWRGLTAPINHNWEEDGTVVECRDCGEPGPSTSNEPTRWHTVIEKLVES